MYFVQNLNLLLSSGFYRHFPCLFLEIAGAIQNMALEHRKELFLGSANHTTRILKPFRQNDIPGGRLFDGRSATLDGR
ncbi:MAG: hypothetical protein JWM11_1827 [Planctomycetaceae bacterium]|nr:hypothetical protein [Planctomycetaceae bacterium]